MAIQPPTVVDVSARTVTARDGTLHPFERLIVVGNALYFGRPGAANPRIAYEERWLVPAQGWMFVRWTPHAELPPLGYDWYIDLDQIEICDHQWSVRDRYLDLTVREGIGYQVHDADELGSALEAGEIPLFDGLAALRALDELSKSLRKVGFSVKRLLQETAPGLLA